MSSRYIVRYGRHRWLVREAVSLKAALSAIDHALVTGSVGSSTTVDRTRMGGGIVVTADVVRLNIDGTEVTPY